MLSPIVAAILGSVVQASNPPVRLSGEWWVSPNGSDSASGAAGEPFRTVQHCANVAAAARGGTCHLAAGVYREQVAFNSSARVNLAALEDGVVLSGLDPLSSLKWSPAPGMECTYKATVGTAQSGFQQLFHNGAMMVEARWPNLDTTKLSESVLDRDAAWEPTGLHSVYGEIHDPALSGFNFSWNGALATLQVAHQFYTWTRPVSNHTAGGPSFSYPKDLPGLAEWSVPSPYQNWAKNQYFLSGKLEALDFPGEWFLDASNTLYFRPVTPTHLGLSQGECPPPPTDGSIEVKIRDYVVTTPQPTNTGPGNCAGNNVTVGLSGLTLLGGTLELWCCAGCTVSNVTLSYPTFNREIPEMDAIPGKTAKTTVAGWNNVIVDSTLTMSNNHGLAVSGSNNAVLNTLIDRTDWLGTLEYIPLAVDGGNGNRVINSTVRYFGNAGVVTSIANTPPAAQNGTQNPPMPMAGRNLEVAYCHIHHGGLIGKDSAALYTGGWSSAGLHWHHNWVHDATEKCIRGDDQSRNMTVHHNVIFNCGRAPVNDSQSEVAGFGLVLKGNGHSVYGNTIFSAATAELCLPSCVERLKPFRPQYPRQTQNGQTTILNSIASVKSAKCGCNATSPVGGTFKGMYAGELASLKLANSDGFPFTDNFNSYRA